MIKLIIPGDPVPCARPRLSAAGGFVRVHDKQRGQKGAIKAMARVEWNKQRQGKPLEGAIAVDMAFYCPLPSGLSVANRNLYGWGIHPHTGHTGDVDNFSKTYLDVLNGLAFHDDRQVIALNAKKFYSLNVRTEIEIMPIPQIHTETDAAAILSLMGPDGLSDLTAMTHALLSASKAVNLIDPTDPESGSLLESVATIISRIADTHGKSLAKIAKEHPGYYLKPRS